ncbi:DNA-3-methyladenine glycosylase family protein [Microbacterium nymphoidis]|uniref:DNA-3-methyladenine glycosylase family protein n=1 Tax=Microbacterium nymphoidis TaxID=2898586 RepID=UPI001E3D6D68|nr:DNA-3-methyladenine glycosylase 2 family protein [Microbacterium nymphoidis]MCD2498772.1 DNA-3-methyladenine glycosylase 2 family protein [Microbacterium nymphoidis]
MTFSPPRTLPRRPVADRSVRVPPRVETRYRPAHELDLMRTVGFHRRGGTDPTMHIAGGVIWRALRTSAGPAVLALRQGADGVLAAAWGSGAAEALDTVPRLCGAEDHPERFDPGDNPLIAEAHRRHPGLRIGSSEGLTEVIVSAVLEQKVTAMQAYGAWRSLVTRFGETVPSPAPRPLRVAPTWDQWRRIPSWAWHRAGVEPPQSRTIVSAASRGSSLLDAVRNAPDAAERERVLTSLTGVGPWTSAEIRIRAFGDPDAVSVGDFHLAHHVGHALAGRRTDDAGMLRLLAPWAGQRQRVIRLIGVAGLGEPRRAPRLHPEDHRGR